MTALSSLNPSTLLVKSGEMCGDSTDEVGELSASKGDSDRRTHIQHISSSIELSLEPLMENFNLLALKILRLKTETCEFF